MTVLVTDAFLDNWNSYVVTVATNWHDNEFFIIVCCRCNEVLEDFCNIESRIHPFHELDFDHTHLDLVLRHAILRFCLCLVLVGFGASEWEPCSFVAFIVVDVLGVHHVAVH
jgi:hypothetical protein